MLGSMPQLKLKWTSNKTIWRGGTLVLLACASWSFLFNPTTEHAALKNREIHDELTHDGARLCVASVNDRKIAAASVISEGGRYVNLALPPNYEGYLTIECTRTNQTTGAVTVESAYDQLVVARTPLGLPIDAHASLYYESPAACDARWFQPGYLDRGTSTWTDCAARAINAAPHKTLLAEGLLCPSAAAAKKTAWISFVGDSVTRQLFEHVMLGSDVDSRGWLAGRGHDGHPDVYLGAIDGADYRVWLSFTRNFVSQETSAERWPIPYTWGDFLNVRGEGSVDAGFPYGKVPDAIFYSPGYLSSWLTATQFGEAVDGILGRWEGALAARNASMPAMHVLLNMMPAPWLIPDEYAQERPHMTQLNEYRKNLALLAAVRKHDFVTSVVDLFSLELPFNGVPGKTAHRDAMHIGDAMVLRIARDIIIDEICNAR